MVTDSIGRTMVNARLAMSRSIGDLELKKYGVTASPDLKKMNEINEKTPAKTFEKRFAPLFVPSREAQRRPDLKALNEKKR